MARDSLWDSTPLVNMSEGQNQAVALLERIANAIERNGHLLEQLVSGELTTTKKAAKRPKNQALNYAIAALAPHVVSGTVPSIAEIARSVDVPVRTLAGWTEFKTAYDRLKESGGTARIRRGYTTGDGIEAVE